MVDQSGEMVSGHFVINFDEHLKPCIPFCRLPLLEGNIRIQFQCPSYSTMGSHSQLFLITDHPAPAKRHQLVLDDRAGYFWTLANFEKSGTWKYFLLELGPKGEERLYPEAIIQLPPKLVLGGKSLALESVKLISVISKWMGPLCEWRGFMEEFRKTGYNTVHFTPLQERGHSNSPYSIKDHLMLAKDLDAEHTELVSFVKGTREEVGLLSMIDLVWNHIACDSPHLKEHPEIGYTLENSPHLQIAYNLDDGILQFSKDVEGYTVESEEELQALMKRFTEDYLPKLCLWEYFVIDVGKHVTELEACIRNQSCKIDPLSAGHKIDTQSDYTRILEGIRNDGKFGRFSLHIDMFVVHQVYADQIKDIIGAPNEVERSLRLSRLLTSFRAILDGINYEKYRGYDERVQKITRNLTSRIRYERIDPNGPRVGPISTDSPMTATYFTRVWKNDGELAVFANNGWIWNADPLVNFAEAPSEAYLLRDVIIWGDCVKLRYGTGPSDCPWLWEYMAEYTSRMATIFHAFRIDNCHSTPINVAEHLLRVARLVNPELYVCAELFTGSAERDMQFISALGLNSLIREAMAAWSVQDLGKHSVEYGGQPLGSLTSSFEYGREGTSTLAKSFPHALFADCTHDNEAPGQRRTPMDALPNAAAVAMSVCGSGSVLGYDSLVPKHINIVHDTKRFRADGLHSIGISPVKALLNEIHERMWNEGYTETYGNVVDEILTLIRENPRTKESFFLLSYHAFSWDLPVKDSTLEFVGAHVTVNLSARLSMLSQDHPHSDHDQEYFHGLPNKLEFKRSALIDGLGHIEAETDGEGRTTTRVHLNQLMPGTVVLLHRKPDDHLIGLLNSLDDQAQLIKTLKAAVSTLGLVELNVALYRCDQEEHDTLNPGGVYDIPGYGKLTYSGIAGFYPLVKQITEHNDLDHPLCRNIREGAWMIEYIINRLRGNDGLDQLVDWLEANFGRVEQLPAYLQPEYFCRTVMMMHEALTHRALTVMGMQDKSKLVQHLALGSVQMIGNVLSAGLHPSRQLGPTMAAGLPHFTTHHMRVWGRDVFLSFKGMFLLLGRFAEAKLHLVAFAGCLYNGLIPNLLDSCRRPRFNSRDATWYFLQALQDYYLMAPEGPSIMSEDVPMRFFDDVYTDFDDPSIYRKTKKMAGIVDEIIRRHCAGIHFTEWNAGDKLDHAMRPAGFEVEAGIDSRTGFVYGGNAWNCGTWMDKMGESEMAGNLGVPATPRDGCAIELTALFASTCRWLIGVPGWSDRVYQMKTEESLSLESLYLRIQSSFETCFYVPKDPTMDFKYRIGSPALVGRRGIYKDTFGASNSSCDYQFRPNFLSAMVFAPELFNTEHAKEALSLAETHLVGPLGMKTLDPADSNYRPIYSHAESSDYCTSKGFNYHQGPEWLWCYGHFLLGKQKFGSAVSREHLGSHTKQIVASPFMGLPELTNGDGGYCEASCQSQAWSMATILEATLLTMS